MKMRLNFLLLFFLLLAAFAVEFFGQSGRTRPNPTPTPRTIAGPSIVNSPTLKPTGVTAPVASSTPALKDHDEAIKVKSAFVPIPVSVTDDRGRPVTTLKLEDFELKVEGKVVEIGEFSTDEIPLSLAILFDNSSSVAAAREFEKKAAIKFLRRIMHSSRDIAALFSVADYTRREHDLTKDVNSLIRAIENFPPPAGATALFDGIIEVAEYLSSAPGRRVLVIISDGEDTYSEKKLEDVVRALLVSNVQVYVVRTTDFENFKRTGTRIGNANTRQLIAERRMQEIASKTGGSVYSPIDENELKEAFDRVSAELSQQYILGYYHDDDTDKDSQFRAISVSVKNRPNLTLRTRKGYFVPNN